MELENVKEERDQIKSDRLDNTDRDELLTKAQTERDNANERRTKAEVDLAKTRIELMQANSQLLESIQQKVELSQQLEQWQVSFTFHPPSCLPIPIPFLIHINLFKTLQMDMQELINEQMRAKLINNRKSVADTPQAPISATASFAKRFSNYKLWSLFQR